MDEFIFASFIVTCHTEGCENAGYPIQVLADGGPTAPIIMCGPCSQQITDITTVA